MAGAALTRLLLAFAMVDASSGTLNLRDRVRATLLFLRRNEHGGGAVPSSSADGWLDDHLLLRHKRLCGAEK